MENTTEFVYDEADHNYNVVTPTETNSSDQKVLWEYNEAKALIKSVETHYEALNHPVKRKTMWNNVSADLESIGIVRTSKQCSEKWKNLLRSYKSCKDNNKKTGRGPTRFMFYDMMDDFLGTKPNNSCSHTISVGATERNEVQVFQTSANTIPVTDETCEVIDNSSQNSLVMNKSKKRKVNGSEELSKKKLVLEEKKLEEIILENKRKDDRYKKKIELMKRKMDLKERKINAFETYLQTKRN